MLFLDFLCLFLCIVLLNAHPISKSNSHHISELGNKLDNGPIIESCSTDQLLNHLYSTWKGPIFEEQDGNTDENNKLKFSKTPKKHIKFKRITTKVIDLGDFEKMEKLDYQKHLHNSIKTYKVKGKENDADNNLTQNTESVLNLIPSFLEEKHVFYNDMSMESTRDDTEFAGTAEIEAILNEIKQREIQMIADQIPSVSNLITKTVSETTFASMPLVNNSSIYPGLVFSTFYFIDNKSLDNFEHNPQASYLRNSKLHNISLRSLKHDTSTLAHEVEDMLQNKIKKVYRKIKNKISKDFNKEVEKTKTTIKKKINKMKNETRTVHVGSTKSNLQKSTTKPIPKTKTKFTLHETRNTRNKLFNMRKHKHKPSTLSTHTIPTVGDDLSMLSIVEKLLEKSEEDNVINMLTTSNNFTRKMYKNKVFKRNSLHETLKQSNRKLLNNDEDVLSTEYTHSDNNINNDTECISLKTDETTEDTSYESLSNKLSYSDYVNGFKYYLKFQKDNEDQKYSNQVRYQAHKHHNVDDIGKFILNKIPQLHTTRLIRDVQDLSTKREDSWFKKHFFIFMESNTPKKFHTSETVSFKPSGFQIQSILFSDQTTKPTYSNKDFSYLKPRRFKKNIIKAKNISTKESLDEPRHYAETEASRSRILKKLHKRSNLENHYKKKPVTLTSINYRKNGFVDIDLINKPTAIIKLNNKNKKTNKIRNIFNKIRFGHIKHKKKEKRQSQNKFNIFKGIKNIFKERHEGEKYIKTTTKRSKIFDYDIVPIDVKSLKPHKKPQYNKILRVDELKQQVPNISADFSIPRTVFSGTYINLTSLNSMIPEPSTEKFIYNKNHELGDERKSVSILTESDYRMGGTSPYFITNYHPEKKQKGLKNDDIFNVNIETNDNVVYPEEFNTISYPTLISKTKSNMRKEGDEMNMRLLSLDAKNKKQTTIAADLRNGHKKQNLHLLPVNIYQNKKKLSKEYHIEKGLKNDVNQNTILNFKKPATMCGTAKIIHLSKKSPRNNKFTLLFNSNFSQPQISILNPLNDKKGKIETKSNRQDIALKTFDFLPTPLVHPKAFAYPKKFINLTMLDKKIGLKNNKLRPTYFEDFTLFDNEHTTNSLTMLEKELATSYKNNVDITIKSPFTKLSTPPEQYYSTPLPMQMDDFYMFLKSQNIDVDSVTAPLFNSLSQRANAWNIYKNNVSKLSNKHNKMIPNKENFETYQKIFKAHRSSNKNHTHANLSKVQAHKEPAKKVSAKKLPSKNVPAKKVPAKPRLEKQKYLVADKNKNRKNIKEIGETHQYEKSNHLLYNEKPKRNLGRKSNLMSHLNLRSMDLFQLDNSHKQPVLNSKKDANDIDVTIIDLDSKNFDSDAYTELSITNFNRMNINQQQRPKTNLSNNIISPKSIKEDPERDPLRFTHMYNRLTLPEQSIYPPLNRYIYKKTNLLRTQPSRIQISGHSYKYDIIYQRSNYDWLSDICKENATLFTNNTINYRNYPTTTKMVKGRIQSYYRRADHTVYKNNDSITFSSNKIKKEIFNFTHFLPNSNEKGNTVLEKKKMDVATMKSKKQFFFSNKDNNIDDEVYFEPPLQYKPNRSKSQGKVSTNNNKYYKRDVQVQQSFTAKDVAALEVVVDLMKSTESFDEKEIHNSFRDNQINIPYIIPSIRPQNHATNAIQVHIALPSNINDKKRSLEPIKVRKIFTATMSSPVDLKYQIHSFEDDKATKVPSNIISPGLYLLVENSNITIPKGNFALKPIRSHIGISNLILPKSSDSILHYKSNKTDLINDHVSKITLNPDVIAAVNNQLVNLYENMATLNKTKSKRHIKKEKREENNQKIKRNINWESFKKYLGHDRFCRCRCGINKTMCKSCAESNAVISELIFDFDNLANYMTDHCTEIQTFFSMNPTGGRKLKDTVHRMDTILNNDYKKVKCKCQGRTCKMISTSIDKREHKINSSMNQFLNYLESLADYLQEVKQFNIICDANVHNAAMKCVKTFNKCVDKNLNKRSYESYPGKVNNKTIYSLNNIRVNLICNKDLTKHATYFKQNAVTEVIFEKNTNTSLYYDDNEIKEDNKIRKGIKELLKKYSDKIKFKKVETPKINVKNNKEFAKKHNKRYSVSYNQIEAPFLADSGGTFWYKYLHGNMREPRQQKNILKEYNTTRTISQKSKLINMNLTTTKFTNATKFANTLTKNNLQEKANEIDDMTFNVDTLSQNLNDLFKLLGNTNTIHESTTKLSKLSILSKKQFSTKIHTSIKTRSTLNTITKVRTTARPSSKTTFNKDHLKLDTSKSKQNTKKERKKESTATKPVSTKRLSPKSLHTIKSTISTSKVGLLNRIVSGSLKFLVNNDKRETTLAEFKSSNIEHRPPIEYVMTYRKKFGTNTEKYSLKEKNYYENDNNDNSKILTEPTIIIINDIVSSVNHTVSKSSQNSTKSGSIEFPSPDTVKRNSFKLSMKKNNADSPAIEMNDISFNSLCNRAKLKNTTQKVSEFKSCDYHDYDNIVHNIRKSLGLTSSNLTTPSERKGAINKIFDKSSLQIISDTKRIEPDEMNSNQCSTSSKVIPKEDLTTFLLLNLNKNVSDTSIKSSTTKTTAAIINTTKNNSIKDTTTLSTDKTSHTESNSLSGNHMTKHLEEAGEEKLNHICDISSTLAYVSKLQKSMLRNNFEQYVKQIPCHEYNKTPRHFIITSCIRNPSKTLFKLNQKSKPFDNRKRIHKWVWIRDKRSMLKDETTTEEAKGKRYKDLEKKCLSGDSVPFIVTNCINIDKDSGNEKVNLHNEVTKNKKISYDYYIKKMNDKENLIFPKRNKIIDNIGIKKRNLFSFSNYPLRRRGYKKNSDLNFNFIQLWYGDNDYYENFVRGKNGIYRKSLKRKKRLDVDMSELNEGLLNLPPLHPFTDEIYVMVANSISFDCHSSGPTKNRNEDYIWTSDRLGILDFDNVMIEGPKVYINKIKTNNFGNYLCSAENSIVRSIKITVIDLPNIDIVFTPVYETDTCSYDDLKSLQKLSEPMSYFTYKYDRSVRIDEPICLKNSNDGSALIRPIVVMSVKRQNTINCSAECLRDLQCSLALLFAKNAPALAFVKVLISYNGTKRILSPLRERRRSFVTHTLRRKDTNGHREYHRLAANMDPNSVNVVLLCSAGFYLVVGQKICAVCPPNTFSLEGENVCRNCPRGARSEPGARSCRLSLHLRKNTCPWKYVCGGAACMLSCVIASCYVVSRLLRQQGSTEEIKTCRKTRKAPRKESHQKKPKNRPLSPSRVILSRLLKGSLSSSRATDSQETRFELWKEKNTLPPLPPIDFEL